MITKLITAYKSYKQRSLDRLTEKRLREILPDHFETHVEFLKERLVIEKDWDKILSAFHELNKHQWSNLTCALKFLWFNSWGYSHGTTNDEMSLGFPLDSVLEIDCHSDENIEYNRMYLINTQRGVGMFVDRREVK